MRSRFSGAVTAADLLHHVIEVCRHSDFSELRYSILDFRDAKDEVNDKDLFEVRAHLIGAEVTNPHILVAALTTDPAVIEHLTRFIGFGTLNRQIQIFSTPELATDWIAEQSMFLLH